VNQRRTPFLVGLAAAAVLFFRGPTPPAPGPQAAGAPAARPSGDAAAGSGTSATQAPEPAGAALARVQASRREYVRLYRDLLGIESPKPPLDRAIARRVRGSLGVQALNVEISAVPEERSVDDADLCIIADQARRSKYHLKFMIALVPDPIDSGLVSDFDLTISALQSGLAEAGYRLDRQWLPWVEPEAAKAKAYRETAGLMLFRRDRRPSSLDDDDAAAGPQLLAVFVVGETLKLGIYQPAFARAVDFILALHTQDRSLPPGAGPSCAGALPPYQDARCPEIPVLGPSSSGSVPSLRQALDRDRTACFRIVSGTATAPNLEAHMEEKRVGYPGSRVRFSRTVVPDDALATEGLAFLHSRLGWDLDRAALLVERDTAYGSYFSGLSPEGPPNPLLQQITKLYFPSGLYALRNAWEASGGATPAQAAAGNPKPVLPKSALEVSLADQGTTVDVVPELSPLTARIYDMALADLLRQIASEGFSYVGILATDVKDQLFLAEQVRRWAPGTVLFVVDNNLLYVHPQYNTTTFGMLTISSFPLVVEGGQRLLVSPAMVEPRSRRQFASERQEGTFLAVRSLVSGLPPPDRAVWIAASGNYATWPIARLDPDLPAAAPADPASVEALGPSPQDPPPPGRESAPDRADFNLAFLALLACVVSYLLRQEASSWTRIQPRTRRWLRGAAALLCLAGAFLIGLWVSNPWAGMPGRGGIHSPPWVPVAWRLWMRLGWLLLVAFGYLAHALVATLGSSARYRWAVLPAACILVLPALALVLPWPVWLLPGFLLLAYGYLAHSLVATSGRLVGRQWVFAALGLSLLLAPTAVVFALWRADEEGLFFIRARAFTGGVSPLVSLGWFGAACFFWLVVELKRQWVRRRHQVPWPLEHLQDPVLAGCNARAARIDTLLQASLSHTRGFWWATLAVVGPPAIFLWTRIQPIAESRPYGRVFLLLTAGLALLSAMTFFRFLELWWLLRGMLRSIQLTDLLPALEGAAEEMEWNPTRFGWYHASFTSVKRSVDRLQRLIGRRFVEEPPGQRDLSELLGHLVTAASRHWFDEELTCRDELNDRYDQAYRSLAHRRGVREVDLFYAVRLIAYLRHVFIQLRYSVMGAMGCDLALIVGVSTFAFQPKNFLILALWSTMVVASAATLVVFVQMERDATLSAIGGSDAGKVTYDWAFVSKLLIYIVVPVVGLVASQFPSLGRLFSSLLDPLARVLGTGG
jgi:hypothetical protein